MVLFYAIVSRRMSTIKKALLAMSLLLLFLSPTVGAIPVGQPPSVPAKPDSPLLVTGYAFVGPKLQYVQLFNNSKSVIDLKSTTVQYAISGQSDPIQIAKLQGLVKPEGYIVIAEEISMPGADFAYSLTIPSEITENVKSIAVKSPSYADESITVKVDAKTPYWKRNISASSGNYLSTFSSFVPDSNFVLYGNGLYSIDKNTSLQFTEIVANPRDCSPADISADCFDFVKIHNPSSSPIDLSKYRIRVGFQGQAATSSTAFPIAGILPPGGYAAINKSIEENPLSLTNTGAFVWLEDTYGIKRYDSTITAYPDASGDTKKGQAWAYDVSDGAWKWTLQPVPQNAPSEFVFPAVKPKVVASASLSPCKEGQYRSEETNRCRSLALAVTALAPCDEDEERNPDTSRCRKIASATNTELAPCKEGQERNSETNRCRNIVAAAPPPAAFQPEVVAETGKAFVGWWALGGIGILAIGYGVWEWRQDIRRALQKVGTFFTSGK